MSTGLRLAVLTPSYANANAGCDYRSVIRCANPTLDQHNWIEQGMSIPDGVSAVYVAMDISVTSSTAHARHHAARPAY